MPTTGPRSLILVLGFLAVLVQAASADEAGENRKRLAAMLLEHRQALARNLERFDAPPGGQQTASAGLRSSLPTPSRSTGSAILTRCAVVISGCKP